MAFTPRVSALRPVRRGAAVSAEPGERKRVVFLGTPDVAARSLRQLLDAADAGRGGGFEIIGVVTQPPARARRGSWFSSTVGLLVL